MKKRLNAFVFAILILAVCLFAACNTEPTHVDDDIITTHEIKTFETDYDLVNNGNIDYAIVYPKETDSFLRLAVTELSYFFKDATGVVINSYTDDAENIPSKIISLGNTSQLKSSGIETNLSELGDSGYRIETVGANVYLIGNRIGTLNAAYEFLHHQFGFKLYAKDEIAIAQGVTSKKLVGMTIKDIPDIEYRAASTGEVMIDFEYMRRLRMNSFSDVWIDINGGEAWHNFFNYVSPATYYEDHPNWFSPDQKQLCLSQDPEGLREVVIAEMKKNILARPDVDNITFTQQDGAYWCECKKCTESKNKYNGSEAAVYIQFVKEVAKEIKVWNKEVCPERSIIISIFAYQRTSIPPVVSDGKGGYKLIDDTVKFEDNMAIFYAPISMNYYYDYSAEENKTAKDYFEKWKVITDKIYVWQYSTNFMDFLQPFNTFNSMQGIYKEQVKAGTLYIFDQHQHVQNVACDWSRLKMYLQSELQWDCKQNQEELVVDFMDNYFRDAAVPMKEMYDFYNQYFAYLAAEKNYVGDLVATTTVVNTDMWPYQTVKKFLSYTDTAFEKILPLKNVDPALYKKLHDRINLETISYRYLMFQLYPGYFTSEALKEFKDSLYSDCLTLGISMFSEGSDIGSYFT